MREQVAILILLELTLQLLKSIRRSKKTSRVAILILLELTLQFRNFRKKQIEHVRRNPYFIGINSAM